MTKDIVMWGQTLSVETMWLGMLLLSFGGLIVMQFLFGAVGLYMTILLAVLGANIQVQKLVAFDLMGGEPVALGTVLFATTYLATDILCERYGRKAAIRGVMIGFFGFLMWTIWMNMTIAFKPFELGGSEGFQSHESIDVLFSIFPQFFVASMVAFLASELLDVWIFDKLRRRMKGRRLWLRNNVSTICSAAVDNTVFSLLAWIVLHDTPLPLGTVIVTYIAGTLLLRIVVALLDTPVVYIGKMMPVLGDGLREH